MSALRAFGLNGSSAHDTGASTCDTPIGMQADVVHEAGRTDKVQQIYVLTALHHIGRPAALKHSSTRYTVTLRQAAANRCDLALAQCCDAGGRLPLCERLASS